MDGCHYPAPMRSHSRTSEVEVSKIVPLQSGPNHHIQKSSSVGFGEHLDAPGQ